MVQSVDASVTGAYLAVATGQVAGLAGARLVAAAAAATAIIRETDGSGRVLAKLSAAVNGFDELRPMRPIAYTGNVHVTVAGAGAVVNLFQG